GAVAGERIRAPAISGTRHHRGDVNFVRLNRHSLERLGCNTDDCKYCAVELQRGAEYALRQAEPGPPKIETDYGNAITIRNTVFIARKKSAEFRLQAKKGKEVR